MMYALTTPNNVNLTFLFLIFETCVSVILFRISGTCPNNAMIIMEILYFQLRFWVHLTHFLRFVLKNKNTADMCTKKKSNAR